MSVELPIVAGTPGTQAVPRRRQRLTAAIFALALLALAVHLVLFLAASWTAIRFGYELDYGEGIVWEQMRLIVAGRGYGAIDGLPAIVFHYPPLYHLVTAAAASLSGASPLAAGRAVSVVSTLVVGLCAGLVAARTVRGEAGPRAALACGLIAGLSLFCFTPVIFWASLMRVDMLSIALSFVGLVAALAALRRPAFIVASGLLFVGAVFTKQTSIVAPTAVFLFFLLLRPRTAWTLAATCLVSGLAVLGLLEVSTNGGFARHVFLYNVNRFDVERLTSILGMTLKHLLFAAALAIGIVVRLRARLPLYRGAGSVAELRRRLLDQPGDAMFGLVLLYAFLAGLMSLSVAKSGSNVNYFIECMAVVSILMGILARDAAKVAFGVATPVSARRFGDPLLIVLLVGLQAAMTPVPPDIINHSAARTAERDRLEALIRAAPRPVSSDDMVLLMRAGVPVPWEPAIFAELAKTGTWDEAPFVARIRAGQFAFFVTAGVRGQVLFDQRYNAAVADAIDAAYPVKRSLAGYTLHFPRAPTPR